MKSSCLLHIFKFLFCAILFYGANTGCEQRPNSKAGSESASPGKQLAEIHCRSCHLYPSPELLDRNSWNNVLFSMEQEMKKAAYQIKEEDWYAIQRYYLEQAPVSLKAPPKRLKKAAGIFQKTDAFSKVAEAIPVATLMEYDPEKNMLYAGDIDRNLFIFKGTELTRKLKIGNIPIDIQVNSKNESLDILGIGDLMPSEGRGGELINISKDGKGTTILDFLDRPVHFIRHDFNGDGKEEYLVSCFGSTEGAINSGTLSMFSQKNGAFQEKIIKELPGATKSAVGDFNKDGKPDIIALFSQGKEILTMFLNKGNLEFEEKQLLEFPPVYGSNDFVLADINRDNYPDIIFTNGDNGDHTPVFKYYHGVRIFVNNGKNEFREKYFFPINGASKVVVRDFDADMDLDMVVLAMYPNLAAFPQESLTYFENTGSLDFAASFIEPEPSGRWLLMDAGDIDRDGDIDLLVGANLMIKSILLPPVYREKWMNSKVAYAVFANYSRQN